MMTATIIMVVLVVGVLLKGLWRNCGARARIQSKPQHLPAELMRQELDRRTFEHRVRTRAVLDGALHEIQRTAREHREQR